MKRKIFKFAFIALIAIGGTLTSCSKEGPQGPQGEQGKEGVQGIPGKDGAVIISGTATPTDDQGKVGDMFLDTQNNKLYGPKAAQTPVWGVPLDIKGGKGDKGKRGNVIHRGYGVPKYDKNKSYPAGTPESKMYFIGDYYINISNGDLFYLRNEVKSGILTYPADWEKVISLKGPRGNANVVASKWKNINWTRDWKNGNAPTNKSYVYLFPTPILMELGVPNMSTFVDGTGIILVYFKDTENFVHKLPAVFRNKQRVSCAVLIRSNENSITFTAEDPYNNYSKIKNDTYFRYVLIPASKTLDARGVDLTKLSYEEVKELYGLED